MPTYDYVCKQCGKKYELFHDMNDTILKHCPVCNGEMVKTISGGMPPIFKGSGWTKGIKC